MTRIKRTILLTAGAILVSAPSAVQAQDRTVETQSGPIRVATIASGLNRPWAMAFLPDGRMLLTERPGRLRIVTTDGGISAPVAGLPEIRARGQGGLLDIALDPSFAANRVVYFAFSEPGDGGAATAVARGALNAAATALENVRVIFRQQPKGPGELHFGSRLVFARDGTLFVTLGDRYRFAQAQDLSDHLGKIVRIKPDGSVPVDNPFIRTPGARPEIWSYGHRNVQGAAIHPATGVLWTHEMGPMGGDEVNIIEPGRNYGWPLVSWGRHYGGEIIPSPATRPDLTAPIHHWTPSIAPSGLSFYTGSVIPAWRGNILIGGLAAQALVRLTIADRRVTAEERIAMGARIRGAQQGPDGAVYLLTDEPDGKLLRLSPARR